MCDETSQTLSAELEQWDKALGEARRSATRWESRARDLYRQNAEYEAALKIARDILTDALENEGQ